MTRLRALLIAPPGAGKGTQADRISQHFGVTHISTGDLFREAVASGAPLGAQVSAFLDRGDLVPDELVGGVVRDAVLAAVEKTGGYLLDGFPRTVRQAEVARAIATDIGVEAHVVLTFDVPRAVLLARLLDRASAEGRTDDNEAVIRHRLEVYDTETAPLLDYYAGLGMLTRIDANRPVDEVTAVALAALEASLAPKRGAT